jgi:hypothetical protein
VNKSTRMIALAILAFSAACSKADKSITTPPDTTVTPPPPPPPPPTDTLHPPPPPPPPVDSSVSYLMAAGNIARCQSGDPHLPSNTNALKTAALIDSVPSATVVTLGNAANPWGTQANYNGCFSASWGRFKDRTWAVIGTHDYDSTVGTTDFFTYWGARAGSCCGAYYSTDVGTWHLVVLNVEEGATFYQTGSTQQNWLISDLAANSGKKCTIVAFNRPRFYSGSTAGGSELTTLRSLWSAFETGGVDVILNAKQYQYERFAPLNAAGARDDAHGMREFIVGMGGESSNAMPSGIHPSSEKLSNQFGVLKLTLHANSYDWAYLLTDGTVFDSGTGSCH